MANFQRDDPIVRSSKNSTSTALAAAATYTGSTESDLREAMNVFCLADQAGTLYTDFSHTGQAGTWITRPAHGFPVIADEVLRVSKYKRPYLFSRVRLVNGAVDQGSLALWTYFGPKAPVDHPLTGEKWELFGVNAAVSTAEDVHDASGDYGGHPNTAIASAETLDVVSADANDDSGGTGMTDVRLIGIDDSGRLAYEDVVMDGTTDVTTSTQFHRLLAMFGIGAGSGGTNAGAITATQSTSSGVFATIPAGAGAHRVAAMTVPGGSYGKLTRGHAIITNNQASGTAVEAQVAILHRPWGSGTWNQVRLATLSNLQPESDFHIGDGIALGPLDDVKVRVLATTAAVNVEAGFSVELLN